MHTVYAGEGHQQEGSREAAERRQPSRGSFQAHSCSGQQQPRHCGNSGKDEEHTLSGRGRSWAISPARERLPFA